MCGRVGVNADGGERWWIMPIPEFTDGGLLPSNGDEPWTASQDEIRDRFAPIGSSRSRLDAWRGLSALVALYGYIFDPSTYPVEWWLHGGFVTAADECDVIELAVLVPELGVTELAGCLQDLVLDRLQRPAVTEAGYNAHIELVFVDRRTEVEQLQADLARVRQQCRSNRVDEGQPLVDAGWVALL